MDAIMAHQAGTKNIVATSGTALTPYQLKILKRYSENISTAFDMDIAGDSATKRGIDLAQSMGFNIKIIVMPEGLDPGDVAKDPQNWQNLINNPKTIHDFYFETTASRFDKNSLEGKKEISKLLLPVIKRIPNKIEQTYWVGSLANILSVRETDILEELAKIRNEGEQRIIEDGSEEISQSAIGLPQKSKRDILEEHLVVLTIKRPRNIEILKEEDLSFFSDRAKNTINFFKENSFDFAVYPEEKKQEYDVLFLKAEAIFEDEKQGKTEQELSKVIEDEFKCCLNSIKLLSIKCRLDDLCSKIKKAEQEKNQEKIKELMEEFNHCSKSLYNLETA
jgi:DNA primase